MTFLLKSLKSKKGLRRYIGPKRVLILLIFTLLFIWARDYYISGALGPSVVEQYMDRFPVRALFIFVLIYIISVVAALPSLALNLAAGFFWGGVAGGIYSTVGVTLGGWVSFLMARWLIGQPLADQCENRWLCTVQDEFERNGWKFVAFARINPIIPTGPLNYLLGLTALTNREFLCATSIFILPPSIAIAYIGDTLQTFAAEKSDVAEIVRGILVVSAAVTFLAAVKYATKIYRLRQKRKENPHK